jgi:RNA polymerase sigma factor (sigma-70 family)
MHEIVRWESESDDRVLAVAAHNEAAFTAFYRRYERPVVAFFLRRTLDPELSADLTAEVFAAVLVSCRRYRPREGPASAWLFGIAHHKLADSRRRGRVSDRARRRLHMSPIELQDADLERIEREAGSGKRGLELLETLPIEQRDAIRAHILDHVPYEEIAREMSCSEAVVRKRVSRGLGRLRKELRREDT